VTRRDPRFRVGLVLTIFCALLFVLVFSLDGTLSWLRGSARVDVRFSTAQGLMKYDPVHFHGVPCGRVVALEFEPPPSRGIASASEELAETPEVSVLLTLEIPPQVRDYLRGGSHASIEKTLTGVTVVNLRQGDGPPLARGEVLTGANEATLADVAGAMEGAVASLGRILADLEPVASALGTEGGVPDLIARFGKTAEEVSDLAAQLRRTTNDLEQPLRDLTERAGGVIRELERSAAEVPDTIAELRGAAHRAGEVAEEAKGLLAQAKPEWMSTTEDIAQTGANLRALSSELRRRPWRLLKAPNSKDAAAIDLYETASRYADGALEVRRALEIVQGALARRSADPQANQQLAEALAALEQSVAKQGTIERTFWDKMLEASD